MRGQTFKQGAQAAAPTAMGYISIGLACGIIGASYVTPLEMALMSILVYAGSAQFAMLALLAIHAPDIRKSFAKSRSVWQKTLRLWACLLVFFLPNF